MTPMNINVLIDIRNATVWGVVPGMNDIYFASDGGCDERRNLHANNNSDAVRVFSQMPTPKTVDPTNFITLVCYVLQNYIIITGYLEHRTLRKRFREICDRLLCGIIKYGSLLENERVSRPNKWTPLDPIDHVADHNRPIVIGTGERAKQTSKHQLTYILSMNTTHHKYALGARQEHYIKRLAILVKLSIRYSSAPPVVPGGIATKWHQ
ncbi:MAG: hypothetical protein EXX96DRAFT_617108 [Benjaminiella poitrasii]|nr:MAG: hypothetical protein EXX96DRAFT_617108 [Benjaminiella poitrasii]